MKSNFILTFAVLLTMTLGGISAKAQGSNIKGDVNGDGVVNAADIVAITNIIMNGESNSGSSLSVEAQKFVGYWRFKPYNSKNHAFVFLPDGTCSYLSGDGEKSDHGYEYGNWAYDETSKILATTCIGWQFQVTIFADNKWAGLTLGSNSETQNFEKEGDHYLTKFLMMNTQWICDTLNMKFSGSYYYFSWDEIDTSYDSSKYDYKRLINLKDCIITENVLTANYEIYDTWYTLGRNNYHINHSQTMDSGQLTVYDVFSPTAKLIMSSKPDHVYIKKTE